MSCGWRANGWDLLRREKKKERERREGGKEGRRGREFGL
jgi:hypothetical protein